MVALVAYYRIALPAVTWTPSRLTPATSTLTPGARRFLTRVFVLLPLVVSLLVFAYRTLFGRVEELPLRLVLAPLALALGFLMGRGRHSSS